MRGGRLHVREVVAYERWLLKRGRHLQEVVAYERSDNKGSKF